MHRTTAWLRDQIAACSPGPGRSPWLADKLGEATESLWRASGMVFGTVLPPRLAERDALLHEATAALQQWLPLLDDAGVLQRIADMARRTSLPIEVAPYLSKLNATHVAKLAPRREALECESDEPGDSSGSS